MPTLAPALAEIGETGRLTVREAVVVLGRKEETAESGQVKVLLYMEEFFK